MNESTKMVTVTPLEMARKAPVVTDVTNIEDLREFFDGYVAVSAYLAVMGIKTRTKGHNPNSPKVSDWSIEFRRIAAESHIPGEKAPFKKSTNGLTVYSLEFLTQWAPDVQQILLRKTQGAILK